LNFFPNRTQEENDFLLAKALHEQEQARRNRGTVSVEFVLKIIPKLVYSF
jgi:hypothetical protein